jgi:hypothetical protein
MPNLEDDLKLNNWLSILTYDIARYAAAGGQVTAIYVMPEGALMLQLLDVDIEKVNGKFRKFLEEQPAIELARGE